MMNHTTLATMTNTELRTEEQRLAKRLCSDFDMSGWARPYADRLSEIRAILSARDDRAARMLARETRRVTS